METHYQRVKKKIQKVYIIRFEKFLREEFNKLLLVEIQKREDRIIDEIMNGTPDGGIQLKGILDCTLIIPKQNEKN